MDQKKIKVKDLEISSIINVEANSDELIFCIHGLGCDKNTFKNILDYPEFTKYNLLIPDLVGFGESQNPDNFSYNLEEQSVTISELLKIFDVKKIHIVAHSMGGAIALLLPEEIRSKIESFASLEGNLTLDDCKMLSLKIASTPFDQFKNQIFEKIRKQFVESELFNFSATTPEALWNSSKSLVNLSEGDNFLKRFKELKTRRAYFFGEENLNSEVIPKLNGIEHVMIARSGHEMMVENPEEFYSRLYDFINNDL